MKGRFVKEPKIKRKETILIELVKDSNGNEKWFFVDRDKENDAEVLTEIKND